MTQKTALISGITGQDGAYLARLLLSKGYKVHGIKRRSSSYNTERIDSLILPPQEKNDFQLHYGDMTDSTNLIRIVQETKPDEIYNLAAQSHVKVSFDVAEYTANADGLGTLRFLEAIRLLGMEKKTKFYQASTSELFGKVVETPQKETTPFYPRSPYACAKLYAYWICKNYREAYGMFTSNGILFNHESPLRGETFVTRKITMAVAKIYYGLQDCLYLGNLDAQRDWGHAREYVEGMWRILNYHKADDFVLATGITTSVRDFIKWAFYSCGMKIEFSGKGIDEVGKVNGNIVVRIDPRYFRPTEVELLLGDASKAHEKLGWKTQISPKQLCQEMVGCDLYRLWKKSQEKLKKPPLSQEIWELIEKEPLFAENTKEE